MDKIFMFDIDGTLTPSRLMMTEKFAKFFDKWSEELDIVSVMNQANSIWKFRHKIKKLGWDNYNTTDEEIKAHILKGEKIAAIKLYRKHQCEVCGKQVTLAEAKEYVDALEKTLKVSQ